MERPRALFFGTPDIAVPSLDALVELAEVVFVVCQPDKPVGRHQVLTAPPVKVRATALGLPLEQPVKLRTGEFGAKVKKDAHAEGEAKPAKGEFGAKAKKEAGEADHKAKGEKPAKGEKKEKGEKKK